MRSLKMLGSIFAGQAAAQGHVVGCQQSQDAEE